MIDFEATIAKAERQGNRAALSAYRALHARVLTAMALPGPRFGQPLSPKAFEICVREETRERKHTQEFLPPSSDAYLLNHAVIGLLKAHLSK